MKQSIEKIPTWAFGYIFNGDMTGLTDEEVRMIDETLKGIRICRQTNGVWVNEFVKAEHPRGGNYFWLTGEYHNMEPGVEGTDHWALDNGYVAITPTRTDVTAYSFMEQLAQWNLEV